MDKKYWAVTVIIIILVGTTAYMYRSEPAEKGSKSNPYMIEDVQDLQDMEEDKDAHYALANDIDASETEDWNGGKGFAPIGQGWSDTFNGSLDGQGHTITGLHIDRPNTSYVGLFGHIYHGEVSDLGLEDLDVEGKTNVGSLVGNNDFSKVTNCYASGKVLGNEYYTGGLVGDNAYGRVTDCRAEVNVSGNMSVGGLVGYNSDGWIKNSYASGDVDGNRSVGGLVGNTWDGEIKSSYSTGDVRGNKTVGGFIGKNNKGIVLNSYSTGNVRGNKTLGGFVGENSGRLENSHYNIDSVLIDGEHNDTLCGLHGEEYNEWIDSEMGKDISFEGGSGTEDDPYLIDDLRQLQAIRNDLSSHYVLADDINAFETVDWNAGAGFRSIGNRDDPFTGTFDGRDHTITGLHINRTNQGPVGLFSYVGGEGEIHNVNLLDVDFKGSSDVGAIAGDNKGAVTSSYATGYLNTTGGSLSTSGGLIGDHTGLLSNSHFADGEVRGGSYIGGLVGKKNEGVIENSHYNIDSVKINGKNRITFSGIFEEQYQDWLSNGMTLHISDYHETLTPDGEYYEIQGVEGLRDLLGFAGEGRYQFHLRSNIDLSSHPGLHIPNLKSEFDGNDHTITGLDINYPKVQKVGLFGSINRGGKVSDLKVVDASIRGKRSVGVLVGENRGTVSNSHTEGELIGNKYLGGLIGFNKGTVSDSDASVDVERTAGDHWLQATQAGGLIGANKGPVVNSFADGSVSGDMHVGGLVGWNTDTVYTSYATGNVDGSGRVGGLMGSGSGKVINSYAKGDVRGDEIVGGLVGSNYEQKVKNCYSVGKVTGTKHTGGLIGYNKESTIKNSFWDVDTSGQLSSDGGTGKTTEELQSIELYKNADWEVHKVSERSASDKDYNWNIVEDETYPFLSGKGDLSDIEKKGGSDGMPDDLLCGLTTILLLILIGVLVLIKSMVGESTSDDEEQTELDEEEQPDDEREQGD